MSTNPIYVEFPTYELHNTAEMHEQCNNIQASSAAVEIPMSNEAFGKMIEQYFMDPNNLVVFDGGDASTVAKK